METPQSLKTDIYDLIQKGPSDIVQWLSLGSGITIDFNVFFP